MKTSLQTAIEFYKLKLSEYPKKYNISQVDIAVHKSYMDIIKYLESLLEKEKQDLIDSCQTGINKSLDYSFEPQDYYNKTFKQ